MGCIFCTTAGAVVVNVLGVSVPAALPCLVQAGLPEVDDERFYEAIRGRLVTALLQLDSSVASEETFVSLVLPFVCLGCTEFDDVTGTHFVLRAGTC